MTEPQAAIERLRKVLAGDDPREWIDLDDVRCLLDEHDPTPITQENVASVGFRSTSKQDWPSYESAMSDRVGPTMKLTWEPHLGCDGWRLDHDLLPPPSTLGELRTLMRGLGIPSHVESQPETHAR